MNIRYADCMIININGYPGVGKLSVAERLRQRIGGRVLDNHSIYNVAFGLWDFGTPEFYETVRAVRVVAFTCAAKLPANIPIILTSSYADTPFGRENWTIIRQLAEGRGVPLCNIIMDCGLTENIRRLQSPERARHRKLIDAQALIAARERAALLGGGGDHSLQVDASHLTADETAMCIAHSLHELKLCPTDAIS